MAFTFLIFLALIGAAILGFVCAWYWREKDLELAEKGKLELANQIDDAIASITQLEAAAKAQQLTFENLQKENQTIENEMISLQSEIRVMEGELKVLEREKFKLQLENEELTEDLQNNVHEISILRDETNSTEPIDPPKNDKDLSELNERIENAKRLVNAFKKGVSENSNTPAEGI
ncbi:MAG: hypothetical protein AAFZ15_29275 [Bacteroidota bacterium]